MKLRRLLFAALLAVCFDVAVPLEMTVHGGLVWEDDEEDALRADERRPSAGAERAAGPHRDAAITRARLAAPGRRPCPARRRRVTRVVHASASPPRPSPTEDH